MVGLIVVASILTDLLTPQTYKGVSKCISNQSFKEKKLWVLSYMQPSHFQIITWTITNILPLNIFEDSTNIPTCCFVALKFKCVDLI